MPQPNDSPVNAAGGDAAALGRRSVGQRLAETLASFGKLGLISFGGPVAHLGYFRAEFVQRRRWVSDAEYADLVALCQFLPGPASSQVVFALGMRRGGLIGALLASVCFTLPSAALMVALAYGVAAAGDLSNAGWLHGLKLAAVAVVAQAVWGMGRNLCPDRARLLMCLAAAAMLLVIPGALTQVAVIALGGCAGWCIYAKSVTPDATTCVVAGRRVRAAAGSALGAFAALLVALPVAASAWKHPWLEVFDSFYRAGSLVFGGGHVVLPLLRAEVVPRGWVTDDTFLAGYGAAQAVPGPLFTFSAYLGASMNLSPHAWLGGLWCLLAIFLPAWLLIGGALPFWNQLRARGWAQAALRGANAAVVGVLLAALYRPVIVESVHHLRDAIAAVAALALLQVWRAPPWAVVLLMACAGRWLLM